MQGHTKLYRFEREDNAPGIEIDYCETSGHAVLRCKSWAHVDKQTLQAIIKALEHVRDHHMNHAPKGGKE